MTQAFNAGAGIEVSITPQLAATVAYQRVWTTLRFDNSAKASLDLDVVTGGLVWRFP